MVCSEKSFHFFFFTYLLLLGKKVEILADNNIFGVHSWSQIKHKYQVSVKSVKNILRIIPIVGRAIEIFFQTESLCSNLVSFKSFSAYSITEVRPKAQAME